MKKIEVEETIVLENGEKYTCFARTNYNGEDYIYLVSNKNPFLYKMAKEILNNNELDIKFVTDKNLQETLHKKFKAENNKGE